MAAEDAGLYRDALGVVPPGGLPDAFLADVPDAMLSLVRRFARTHGPFETGEVRARYGVDAGPALAELERAGELVLGELRPLGTQRSGATPTCCAVCAVRRWRCCARRSSPSGRRAWRASPRVAGRRPPRARRRRRRSPARRAGVAAGPAAGAGAVGEGRPAAPARDLLARTGSTSCAPTARWSGSAPGRWAGAPGASRCTSATTRRCSARRRAAASDPAARSTTLLRERLGSRRLLLRRPTGRVSRTSPPTSCARRCGTWSGPERLPTTPSRRCGSPRRQDARSGGAARRPSSGRFRRRASRRAAAAGPLVAGRGGVPRRAADPGRAGRAWAELLLERHGVLTRELVRAEGYPGGFVGAVPGAVGARDARRGPPRLLRRGPRRRPVRAARRRRAAALAGGGAADARARHRHRRSGAAVRRRAALAGRRGAAAVAARRRLPGHGRRPPVRCRSTPAGARCGSSAGATTSSRRSRPSRRRSAPAACASSPWTPSTASRPSSARSPSGWSPLGFRRGLHDFALAPGDA